MYKTSILDFISIFINFLKFTKSSLQIINLQSSFSLHRHKSSFMKKNISATFGKLGRLFLDFGDKKYIYIFGRLPNESRDLDHTNLLGSRIWQRFLSNNCKKLEFSYRIIEALPCRRYLATCMRKLPNGYICLSYDYFLRKSAAL